MCMCLYTCVESDQAWILILLLYIYCMICTCMYIYSSVRHLPIARFASTGCSIHWLRASLGRTVMAAAATQVC